MNPPDRQPDRQGESQHAAPQDPHGERRLRAMERLATLPPRERTFAQVFPWRNIGRALMLVLLIVAIVSIKRSAGPLLAQIGQMWGPPSATRPATPAVAPGRAPAGR